MQDLFGGLEPRFVRGKRLGILRGEVLTNYGPCLLHGFMRLFDGPASLHKLLDIRLSRWLIWLHVRHVRLRGAMFLFQVLLILPRFVRFG